METQLLIAALKAQLIVLRAGLGALGFEDHSNNAVRRQWNVASEQCNAVEAEIKRLEGEI